MLLIFLVGSMCRWLISIVFLIVVVWVWLKLMNGVCVFLWIVCIISIGCCGLLCCLVSVSFIWFSVWVRCWLLICCVGSSGYCWWLVMVLVNMWVLIRWFSIVWLVVSMLFRVVEGLKGISKI